MEFNAKTSSIKAKAWFLNENAGPGRLEVPYSPKLCRFFTSSVEIGRLRA
jgi:hypothetical protein